MAKRKPNQEVFKDGNKEIVLVADFGFLEAVNSHGTDVSILYSELASGMLPPAKIRNILICAMGDEIENKKEYAEDLITRYGLQECGIMASMMLTHAMIGDVKKSSIERKEKVKSALETITGSPSMSLRKVGCLWMAQTMISITLACLTFKICAQFIA